MNMLFRRTAALAAAAFLAGTIQVPAAQAQDSVWGPWQKVKCEPLRAGALGGIESPQGNPLATERAMQCTWIRHKNECPKLRSKVLHPIKCFNRSEKRTETGQNPPRG